MGQDEPKKGDHQSNDMDINGEQIQQALQEQSHTVGGMCCWLVYNITETHRKIHAIK